MRLYLIGRPVGYVDAPAVRPPAGNSGSEALVGVSDAPVVFFFEFVLKGIGRGVAAQPELLDKLFPLVRGSERFQACQLFPADDVCDILIKPFP